MEKKIMIGFATMLLSFTTVLMIKSNSKLASMNLISVNVEALTRDENGKGYSNVMCEYEAFEKEDGNIHVNHIWECTGNGNQKCCSH